MLHFLAVAKKPEPAKDDKEEDELTSEFSSIELFHAGDDLEFEEEELIGSFIIQYLEAPFIADRRSEVNCVLPLVYYVLVFICL